MLCASRGKYRIPSVFAENERTLVETFLVILNVLVVMQPLILVGIYGLQLGLFKISMPLFFLFRHNIQILERNYAVMQKGGNHLHFADIDVDPQTGIVLQNLLELHKSNTAEPLIIKLASLSTKYSCCWLLLYSPLKGNR